MYTSQSHREWKGQLNRKNPLGHKGEIGEVFGLLMMEIWGTEDEGQALQGKGQGSGGIFGMFSSRARCVMDLKAKIALMPFI